MKILRSLVSLLLLIFSNPTFAQSEQDVAKKVFLANINTLLIFTQESGLSSGKYTFDKAGFNMQTYSLPFIYNLDQYNDKINLFIDGGIGYSKTKLNTTVKSSKDIDLNYKNKLQTYTGGLGLGLRYKSDLGIDLLSSLGFIYSRVGVNVNPNDDIGDAIKDFFNNNYNENLTFKFLISAEYYKSINGYKTYVKADYKLYKTLSDFTFNAISKFSAQSSSASLSFGLESAPLFRYKQNTLTLEPYLKLNYLNGDITNVVKFNNYLNTGIVAYYNTPNYISWIKRFFLEYSLAQGSGIEGYNLGIGFSIDY